MTTQPCVSCGQPNKSRLGQTCCCGTVECAAFVASLDAFMLGWSRSKDSRAFKKRFVEVLDSFTRETG